MKKLIGIPCLVNVIHQTSKNGYKYAKITGVSQIPKNTKIPELTRITQFLSFDDKPFDFNIYNSLPIYLQNKIAESYEFKIADGQVDQPREVINEIVNDDVPF